MTIQRDMVLCCLLVMGTYVYGMENPRENEVNKRLTQEKANRIKMEAVRYVKREDGKIHSISQYAMDFIIKNEDTHKAFLVMKQSKGTEKAELSHQLFDDVVDSYVRQVILNEPVDL